MYLQPELLFYFLCDSAKDLFSWLFTDMLGIYYLVEWFVFLCVHCMRESLICDEFKKTDFLKRICESRILKKDNVLSKGFYFKFTCENECDCTFSSRIFGPCQSVAIYSCIDECSKKCFQT